MPPKKNTAAADAGEAITGFSARDTKLMAAAFVASTGPDKYDYDLFATLTGNTVGSLKKMWPPVKRKIAEAHPSFGNSVGGAAGAKVGDDEEEAAKPKANNRRKRKAASTEPDNEQGTKDADTEAATNGDVKKKAPAKGRKKKADGVEANNGDDEVEKKPAAKRNRKQVKSEETCTDEADDEMVEE